MKIELKKEKKGRGSGLPDFSWYNIPNREKIYQMPTKYYYYPIVWQNI
jgi:hypothetical protein